MGTSSVLQAVGQKPTKFWTDSNFDLMMVIDLKVHPEGCMHVCTEFHRYPSNSSLEISLNDK